MEGTLSWRTPTELMRPERVLGQAMSMPKVRVRLGGFSTLRKGPQTQSGPDAAASAGRGAGMITPRASTRNKHVQRKCGRLFDEKGIWG